MNRLKDIVKCYEAMKLAERRSVLATVVKAGGALHQSLGSRLMFHEDGTTTGSMGDEELQNFLTERARKMFDSEGPRTVSFSPTTPAHVDQATGSVAHILLEPLPMSARSIHLRFIADCVHSGKSGIVASVFRVDGEFKAWIGTHVFLYEDGKIEEDVRNPVLTAAMAADCARALQSRSSFVSEYRFTEGVVEAFIEFIAGS